MALRILGLSSSGSDFSTSTGTRDHTAINDFDEASQDAVGGALTDTATVDFTYDDVANTIAAAVLDSPTVAGATPAQLRDRSTHTGTQTAATISDFNEAAQDAVGTILTDSSTVDFTYDDTAGTVSAAVTGVVLNTLADAKGDLFAASAADVIGRLGVGTAGQMLIPDSAAEFGLKWVDATRILPAVIDGGGSVLTTGAKTAYVTVPIDCTITRWRLLADQSGSVVLDIWRDAYANYPPTVADTITASDKPTISAAIKAEGAALTGWTVNLNAGDILEVNVDSATTITKVYLHLFVIPR